MYKNTTKKRHQEYDLYDDVEKIKDVLRETAYDVRGKAQEVLSQSYDEMKSRKDHFQEGVAEYTAEKPFKSLGIALFVGVILGYFIHK